MTMISPNSLALSWLFLFVVVVKESSRGQEAVVIDLDPTQFYEMAALGQFRAIVDVRTLEEWQSGHIENATFLESLQNAGTAYEIASIADLDGCDSCPIVVYCNSGLRSAAAIDKLILAGFKGPLYNGMGVCQWTESGYPLVNADSVDPSCQAPSRRCTAAADNDTIASSVPAETQNESPSSGSSLLPAAAVYNIWILLQTTAVFVLGLLMQHF